VALFLAKPVKIMRPIPIKSDVITSLFLMISGKKSNITPRNKNVKPESNRQM